MLNNKYKILKFKIDVEGDLIKRTLYPCKGMKLDKPEVKLPSGLFPEKRKFIPV